MKCVAPKGPDCAGRQLRDVISQNQNKMNPVRDNIVSNINSAVLIDKINKNIDYKFNERNAFHIVSGEANIKN